MSSTPRELYGDLFHAVQVGRVLGDGKAFVDALPRRSSPAEIVTLFERQRTAPNFSLAQFVAEHFDLPASETVVNSSAERADLREHICALWPQLLRQAPMTAEPSGGSLLGLPHAYVVPGGRFREVYYWDSYFTLIGLVECGQGQLAEDMVNNFASLIDRYGHIPNGNRSYYLSRSQPPFFYKMVSLLARAEPALAYAKYLPQLIQEHSYWMAGEDGLAAGQAHAHVVRLSDGALLNRYWDASDMPREESYEEDLQTAAAAPTRPPAEVFRDLRAAAESGWDFSSRWCAESERLESIQTTALLPVDLNSLLFGLECAIAAGCRQAGDAAKAAGYAARAEARHAAIDRNLWSEPLGHYVDYHWQGRRAKLGLSAATVLPLYVGLASSAQARTTCAALQKHLLAANGLLTTRLQTSQQWDAPNGWAPLQWMAIKGLLRYGHLDLAREIASRWLGTVQRVYASTGKLMEKYDVVENRAGGGGEYPSQDGFGWTNGVCVALLALYPDL